MRGLDRVLVVLVVLAFLPALPALARAWSASASQSHGFLVPLVALWVAWRERARLARVGADRDARGLLALAAALGVYAAGLAAGRIELQALALVGAVAASTWTLAGAARLRALAFPLAFLLFAVPLPEAWIAPLVVRLQLAVSQGAVAGLQALGSAVMREGNVIVLPEGGRLFVAEACSGVVSIVTLMPLAALLAYLGRAGWWRGALLVLAAWPIALAANLLRVVGTVLGAEAFGVERATSGVLHDAAGVLVYALGCLGLIAVGALLQRIGVRRAPASAQEARRVRS